MGVEHPYLAILATIAFMGVVISSIFLYVYVVDQVNKSPALGVYAEAYTVSDSVAEVLIKIRHERGNPVKIQQIIVYAGKNTITISGSEIGSNPSIGVEGCNGNVVIPGSICVIKFNVSLPSLNAMYQGLVFLSEGTYPIAFIPINKTTLAPPVITLTTTRTLTITRIVPPENIALNLNKSVYIGEAEIGFTKSVVELRVYARQTITITKTATLIITLYDVNGNIITQTSTTITPTTVAPGGKLIGEKIKIEKVPIDKLGWIDVDLVY
ncbi:hypothetical protein QPL79_04905 [Ignisphaera sp. 4213-co]|uniref:Archaeal Type IV pilin N-terminal domain-containing protein n=1 Tax=Ignisphaera cupida TaxID=3050454 RepID=A0ABD4Z654_9CREN|nr:hypothetical protein [Ignisphaera sp. 4213-co]MDK6028694.1 hypothetical protein [Ignisphaera sp. 4213-co]